MSYRKSYVLQYIKSLLKLHAVSHPLPLGMCEKLGNRKQQTAISTSGGQVWTNEKALHIRTRSGLALLSTKMVVIQLLPCSLLPDSELSLK